MAERNLKHSVQQLIYVDREMKDNLTKAAKLNDESGSRLCRRAIIKEINFIKESNL